MEVVERNSWVGGPVGQETQIPHLHLFYSMILGKSLSLSVPQFLHVSNGDSEASLTEFMHTFTHLFIHSSLK